MARQRALQAKVGEEFNPLKHIMTRRRMTVEELAKRAGIAKGTIYGWLKPGGLGEVTIRSLRKVADVFGISPYYFIDAAFRPQPFTFVRSHQITCEIGQPVIGHTKGNVTISRHELTPADTAEYAELWRHDGEAALYVTEGKLLFLYEDSDGPMEITKSGVMIRCKIEILSEGDGVYIDSQHFHGIYLPDSRDPIWSTFCTDGLPVEATAILFQYHV